jgi:hypothetical protein
MRLTRGAYVIYGNLLCLRQALSCGAVVVVVVAPDRFLFYLNTHRGWLTLFTVWLIIFGNPFNPADGCYYRAYVCTI